MTTTITLDKLKQINAIYELGLTDGELSNLEKIANDLKLREPKLGLYEKAQLGFTRIIENSGPHTYNGSRLTFVNHSLLMHLGRTTVYTKKHILPIDSNRSVYLVKDATGRDFDTHKRNDTLLAPSNLHLVSKFPKKYLSHFGVSGDKEAEFLFIKSILSSNKIHPDWEVKYTGETELLRSALLYLVGAEFRADVSKPLTDEMRKKLEELEWKTLSNPRHIAGEVKVPKTREEGEEFFKSLLFSGLSGDVSKAVYTQIDQKELDKIGSPSFPYDWKTKTNGTSFYSTEPFIQFKIVAVAEMHSCRRFVIYTPTLGFITSTITHQLSGKTGYYDLIDVNRLGFTPGRDFYLFLNIWGFASNLGAWEQYKLYDQLSAPEHVTGISASRYGGSNPISLDTKNIVKNTLREQAEMLASSKIKEATSGFLTTTRALLDEALTDGTSKKLGDLTFSDKGVEYLGQLLSATGGKNLVKRYFDAIYSRLYRTKETSLNFDGAFEEFVNLFGDYELRDYRDSEGVTLTIGTIKAEIKRVGNLMYINGFRVNQKEVEQILRRSLCFTEQSLFNNFISEVSKCSLRFHTYLAEGVTFTVFDDLFREFTARITLPLSREGQYNYLIVGKDRIKLKDSNTVLGLAETASSVTLTRFIEVFSNTKVVERAIDPTVIKPYIDSCKKAYEDAITKSQKLLDKVLDTFKLSIDKHKIGGSTVQGIRVKGHRDSYVIEYDPATPFKSQRFPIYRESTGNYVCIVDKSSDQAGADPLINRIYALANDNLLVTKISTL